MFRVPRARLTQATLYIVLSRPMAPHDELMAIARASLGNGADIVQLRQKHAGGAELLALARELREATREHELNLARSEEARKHLDAELLSKFRKNALARAQEFDVETIVPYYESYYEEVIESVMAVKS